MNFDLVPAGWRVGPFVACISSRIKTIIWITATFVACISSRIVTVIHITTYDLTNCSQSAEPFQLHCVEACAHEASDTRPLAQLAKGRAGTNHFPLTSV